MNDNYVFCNCSSFNFGKGQFIRAGRDTTVERVEKHLYAVVTPLNMFLEHLMKSKTCLGADHLLLLPVVY